MPATAPAEDCNHHEVVIMGAGMSGLCMAMQLKAAGQHDFVVLEKSAGLGGTWWDNRYPGAQVDVPAPVYCFSFEPNTRWQRRFAAAPEIQAYMAHCAAKYGITPHLRLGTQVTGAEFDKVTGRWAIHTADGRTRSARYFVCSTGPLSHPRWPDIPGLADFAGQRLHSAQWDASVALAGRRVAVIGTGSTAAQLVAPVAAQAARLHVFQRTANWVLPRMDRPYGALDHALARLPPYNAAVRALWTAVLEWGRRGFDDGTLARRGMQRTAAAHLQRQVADPALRQQLRPPYPLGCKRIIYANDYYPALAQPHVELVTTGIQRISAHGVQTVDGRQRDVDVLVCATGFDVQHALTVPITGRHGQTLAQAWADGPQAHLGLTVAGFPNLFLMLGPNTATGHTSTLLFIEPGVRWVLRAMQEVQRRGQRWLDVRPEVMQASNAALQARLEGAVWSQCRSWYRADSGRNIAIWPGFTREYVRAVGQQPFTAFEFG
jgi:cation diffusion facilitator CzcD-associated flavoprotein CzcO